MAKIPKQRGSGGFGGGGHGDSKFKSVRRGGRPSAGRAKSSGCVLVILTGGAIAVGAGTAVGQWLS